MNDKTAATELPVVDLASTTPASAAGPASTAQAPAAEPLAAPAESTPAAVAAPAVEEAKPFIAAEEPTALEVFDAEQAKAADKKPDTPAAAAPAEGDKKPVAAADAKPGEPDKKPDSEAAKAADPAKPEDAKPAEPAPLEPIAYEYRLPDTLKMDDAQKGKFHSALDGFRKDSAKGVQGLVDLHNDLMAEHDKALRTQYEQAQQRAFADTRKGWLNRAMADEEFGGAGWQTSLKAMARARDTLVSSAKPGSPQYQRDMKEFNDFLRVTGGGDHPALLRFLHNAAPFVSERQFSEMPTSEIRPSPTNGRGRSGMYSAESIAKMNGGR